MLTSKTGRILNPKQGLIFNLKQGPILNQIMNYVPPALPMLSLYQGEEKFLSVDFFFPHQYPKSGFLDMHLLSLPVPQAGPPYQEGGQDLTQADPYQHVLELQHKLQSPTS